MKRQLHNLIYRPETEVSKYIRALPFLFLSVDTLSRIDNARAYIESNIISLLSHPDNQDRPSADWLGRYRGVDEIDSSGLWNVRHVGGEYEPAFLDHFESLADRMCRSGV